MAVKEKQGGPTRKVLLTIMAPQRAKRALTTCTCPQPSLSPQRVTTPRGTSACRVAVAVAAAEGWAYQPWVTHQAMVAVRARVEGMGRPSKYFDLPVGSAGMRATVALKRARRARPQERKRRRARVSSGVRRPRVNARTAGAIPKETRSARESISWPSMEPPPMERATLPSRASKPKPRTGRRWAK